VRPDTGNQVDENGWTQQATRLTQVNGAALSQHARVRLRYRCLDREFLAVGAQAVQHALWTHPSLRHAGLFEMPHLIVVRRTVTHRDEARQRAANRVARGAPEHAFGRRIDLDDALRRIDRDNGVRR